MAPLGRYGRYLRSALFLKLAVLKQVAGYLYLISHPFNWFQLILSLGKISLWHLQIRLEEHDQLSVSS